METLSPNKELKTSTSSSSGCSTSSSTTDIKKYRHDMKVSSATRSRSFFHTLSKHLGRHFLHHSSSSSTTSHRHHHQHRNGQTIVYNSQEDLRSSSTDSFSLSYERNSRSDCETNRLRVNDAAGETNAFNSNLDLSSEERTSRTSSASACSPFSNDNEEYDNTVSAYRYSQRHFYLDTSLYRQSSTFNCQDVEEDLSENDSGNSSSSDETDNAEIAQHRQKQQQHFHNKRNENENENEKSSQLYNMLQCPLEHSNSKVGGLHLSRISITSSVRSIFQHFSAGPALSSRCSRSCNSTPLKRVWDVKCKKSKSTPNHSSNSNSGSKATLFSINTASIIKNSSNNKKKPEKKQQSILRPPINYVHMKGMSGLYSRVPRYTVCCPYGTQQWA